MPLCQIAGRNIEQNIDKYSGGQHQLTEKTALSMGHLAIESGSYKAQITDTKEQKLENELRIQHQNLNRLQQMQKNLTDKMRSMRLQRRGAILEKHLGSDQLTDQQIELLLKTLFRRPDVHELIQQLKQENQ